MDIKDSYLHGTVGVVKSISVAADKLSYKLADVAGTTKTVTMPTATQSANGLLSSTDKKKLDSITGPSLSIPYIVGPDTDTTKGTWTGSYSGITAYTDGLTIIYVPKVAGASTTTLNINGLGAKTCYYTGTSKLTTHYAAGTPILFTYSGGAWKRADYYTDSNTYTSAWCNTAAATAAKTASCTNYTLKANSYIHILIRYANTVTGAITLNINGSGAKPIYINGSASSASNYTLPAGTYIIYYDGTNFHFRTDDILPGKILNSTLADGVVCSAGSTDTYRSIVVTPGNNTLFYNTKITANYSTGDLKATSFTGTLKGTADKVANNLVIKLKSGTTEGTDLYTYNGSAAKTLDIKQGTGITLTAAANALTITNSGVRSIATGTTNGTISVNTNGTSANVAVKGLGSAAYTSSGGYIRLINIGTITDPSNLYTKVIDYFGDNRTVMARLKSEDGLWGHLLLKFLNPTLSTYGVDGSGLFMTGSTFYRWSFTGKDTTEEPLVVNKYKIYDEGNLGVVSSSVNGLAPKVINTNTATVGSAYYVLASTNGSATPSWYKLPSNAFANDDTKVTQTNTTGSASYRVLFSGNANDTTETTTARKSANLLFNPSTGNLTATSLKLNGNIIINDGTNNNRYIQWLYNNTDEYSWRIGYLGSGGANNNFLVFDSYREKQGWATALKFEHTTMIAHFGATVNAPTFQGNLDGTYVNKLTNYAKATAIGSIAATDSLNTALGKLEFKTDFIYNDLFGTDNDDVINKWYEIVDFIDSVKEGTDITDEFVTRKTKLTITGLKNFTEILTSSKQLILKGPERSDIINVLNADKSITTNAPTSAASIKNALQFNWYDTSWEIGNIRGSSTNTEGFGITAGNSHLCFRVTTTNCYVGSNVILHAGNSNIKNGVITINGTSITPLTSHQSLANYVTLNTGLTITGFKTFKRDGNIITSIESNNSVESSIRYINKDSLTWIAGVGTSSVTDSFGIWSNTLQANVITCLANGNVGIGTKTASEKLHVSGNVLATKFVKSGGTSSQFLKADGSVDSNKYLINSNSSYTTSYARDININGSNWTFWSPVNSSTSGTVYGPTNAGTKDLVLLSSGSGAPYWTNLSNLKISSLIPTTILSSGSNKFNYVKFASINLTSRYSGMYAILKLTHHFTTSTDYGTSCDLYVHCYQLDPIGTIPRYTIKTNNDDSSFTIVGIVNYSSTSSTLDLYVHGKSWTYLSINVLKLAGDNIINIGTNIETLPSGTQVIPLKTGHVEIANSVKNALTFASGAFAAKTYNGSAAVTVNVPTKTSHLTNDSGYLTSRGYIGTTAVQASSAALALTGITNATMSGITTTDTLVISRKTNAKHIMFSRGSATDHPYNYIAAPAGGLICILPNGAENSSAGGMQFSVNGLHPATSLGYSLGTSSLLWNAVYANTFHGALKGNADSASKLTTVSKTAWGLTYWTSGGVPTSISGDMTGVGNITIDSNNVDRFITFKHNTTPTLSWRIGYLGTGESDANYLVMQSSQSSGTWVNALRLGNSTLDAAFGGNVYPLVNNTKTLGTSSLRWSNIYSVSGNYSGNITLYKSDGGDSPHLVFLRGTTSDGSYDWRIYDNGGSLKFQYCNADVWTEILSLYSNGITSTAFIKSGSSNSYVLLGGGGHKTISSLSVASANKLNSTEVISAKAFSLSNASWTDTSYTFASLASGTYAVQITSGSNLVASGIMSVYKNLSDTAGDEIPLHVYGTAGWRPYLRTYNNKLLISSNDASATSRTVTIKIALIL